MALEENVATLEGIDEKHQALYVENSEGTFDIDISGLQSAIKKERLARKALEKKAINTVAPTEDELVNQLKDAKATITTMKVTGSVKSAALKAGVDPAYIDDVLSLTKGNFVLDSEGAVTVVDGLGDPTGQSVDRYFKYDYKKAKPRYYNSSGKSGSGSQGNLGNADPNTYSGQVNKAIKSKNTLELIKAKNKILNK